MHGDKQATKTIKVFLIYRYAVYSLQLLNFYILLYNNIYIISMFYFIFILAYFPVIRFTIIYMWQNFRAANFPNGKISVRRIYLTAKFPYGEFTLRQNFRPANFPRGEFSYGKISTAKFPTAKFPTANSPVTLGVIG